MLYYHREVEGELLAVWSAQVLKQCGREVRGTSGSGINHIKYITTYIVNY